MEINKERFEAYLYSQPRSTRIDIKHPTRCLLCAFIEATTNKSIGTSWTHFVTMNCFSNNEWAEIESGPVPEWFRSIIPNKLSLNDLMRDYFTMGELQDMFRQIFPLEKTESGLNDLDKPDLTSENSRSFTEASTV